MICHKGLCLILTMLILNLLHEDLILTYQLLIFKLALPVIHIGECETGRGEITFSNFLSPPNLKLHDQL